MKKVVIVAVMGLVLAGCANQTTRDLEKVPVQEPDKAEIYVNVDEYANITRQCIDGLAFIFTTRDYNAVFRVPEWDKTWCAE